MKKKPSLQDIASELGVSKMTVSLALRDHPSISGPTKDKVISAAARIGYKRNLELSNYMAAMRRGRSESAQLPIAYLTTGESPDTWKKSHTQVLYRKGAHEQANAYGYHLDEFWIDAPGMTTARLNKILWNRGIQGVLVHPFNPQADPSLNPCKLDLPWDQFSTVIMSDTLPGTGVNRIIHSHYESMLTTMNTLTEKGYRRIGYCMSSSNDFITNRRWYAAYLVYRRNNTSKKLTEIPPLIAPEITADLLGNWIEKYKLDAFIGASPRILAKAEALGIRLGEDIAYADLDLDLQSELHKNISGIDQNSLHFGHAAVDLVINGILKSTHGISRNSMTIQIEGTWCERGSTPDRS